MATKFGLLFNYKISYLFQVTAGCYFPAWIPKLHQNTHWLWSKRLTTIILSASFVPIAFNAFSTKEIKIEKKKDWNMDRMTYLNELTLIILIINLH